MKFLVVGFSGIEMPTGFVPVAQQMIAQNIPGVILESVGIGGITHDHLAHFIDRILVQHSDSDYVIYCIANTNYREVRTDVMAHSPRGLEIGWDEVESLARASRRLGIRTAFLNFPRASYDYKDDKFETIIEEVSRKHAIGYRSISREFKDRDFDLSSILIDASHPNSEGVQLYAKLFVDFAEQILADNSLSAEPIQGPFRRAFTSTRILDLIPAVPSERRQHFSRYGFEEEGYILKGGETLALDLGAKKFVSGFAALAGPRAGRFWVKGDGEVISAFMMYDQHCYYSRLFCWNIPSIPVRRLEITQDVIIPEADLLKGEKDPGPREVSLFYILETNYGV